MLRGFALLERSKVERLWLAALLTLDQRLADAFTLKTVLLLTSDKIADCLTVVGIAAGVDLRGNPQILLLPGVLVERWQYIEPSPALVCNPSRCGAEFETSAAFAKTVNRLLAGAV